MKLDECKVCGGEVKMETDSIIGNVFKYRFICTDECGELCEVSPEQLMEFLCRLWFNREGQKD